MRMGEADGIRSLDARVARLTKAVARTCDAQLQSVETVNQLSSDMAALMADVRELGRRHDNMAVVLSRLVSMLRVRREAKGTSAMPVCGGLWDDEIESMTAEGASLSEIAARIGCGVATVSRRRRQLGAEGSAYKRKWTDREDAVLREAVKLAGSWAEVAENLPGRTEAACCARAKRHGLRLRHNPPHAWTSDEDAFLREHWVSCDMETPEIARALGRTEHAVRTRASKLGIADSKRRKWALAKSSARFWARGAA